MGEFSPPFFEPPSFFFFSYPSNIDSNIEIIFDFSDFHPPFQNPGSAPAGVGDFACLHQITHTHTPLQSQNSPPLSSNYIQAII